MIVLSIPVPFQLFIIGITGPALVHALADPQPAFCRVQSAFLFTETADPAGPWVIVTVSSEYEMDLIDEVQRELLVLFITCLTIKPQEVADGKSVCP